MCCFFFKFFEADAAYQTEISFKDANIQEICHNISGNPNATEPKLTILFQNLRQMTKIFDLIDYNTRESIRLKPLVYTEKGMPYFIQTP